MSFKPGEVNGEPPKPPLFCQVAIYLAFRLPLQKTPVFGLNGELCGAGWARIRTIRIIAEVNAVDNSGIPSCRYATAKQPMVFSITSRSDENFAVLELSGPLTLSPALSSLREAARKVLGTPHIVGLILHVSGVTSADSAGLGELTVVYTFASQRSCPLRLVGATPSLRKMLEMTRLEDLFQPVDSVVIAKSQMRS